MTAPVLVGASVQVERIRPTGWWPLPAGHGVCRRCRRRSDVLVAVDTPGSEGPFLCLDCAERAAG